MRSLNSQALLSPEPSQRSTALFAVLFLGATSSKNWWVAEACCSLKYKKCDATWCDQNDRYECEVTCVSPDGVIFLKEGPLMGDCLERWEGGCDATFGTGGRKECCPGLDCIPQSGGSWFQCLPFAQQPRPWRPPTLTPTASIPMPTRAPVSMPSPRTPSRPTPPWFLPTNKSILYSSDRGLTAYEAFLLLEARTYKIKDDDTSKSYMYSHMAEGGAAGNGGYVVSESQAYALLGTGLALASWDSDVMTGLAAAHYKNLVKHFRGYFNGWKKMCQNSNPIGCQPDGYICSAKGRQNSVCLPGWKHKFDLSEEVDTGAAPDGDIDAITGMILAIKAFERQPADRRPTWYDEVRLWADQSCTAFLRYNTVPYRDANHPYRLLKLGTCWGGWENEGNNPSYYSPGMYKLLRDFHINFPDKDRNYNLPDFGGNPLEGLGEKWDNLIRTSYDVLSIAQCASVGTVPNWITITVDNGGNIANYGGQFSGSGTPQWQFGAEAARTMWRVAFDAAMHPADLLLPSGNGDSALFLAPLHDRLNGGYGAPPEQQYWREDTLQNCDITDMHGNVGTIYPFGNWRNEKFIYGPVMSALIVPFDSLLVGDQQRMIDNASAALANAIPGMYFPRSWAMLSALAINGAVERAGRLVNGGPIVERPMPVSSLTVAPTAHLTTRPADPQPQRATPTPSPSPAPLPSPSLECDLGSTLAQNFWIVTEGDATNIAFSWLGHGKGVAVGGSLSSNKWIRISAPSFIADGTTADNHRWTFQGTLSSVRTGNHLSEFVHFDQLKHLANSVQPLDDGDGYRVIVRDRGGSFTARSMGVDTWTNNGSGNLCIWRTSEDVVLGGSNQWHCSILAPFARVMLEGFSEITGTIVARELVDTRVDGGMHGLEYNGPLMCASEHLV